MAIHVLDAVTVSKIAAGEVVERPASVLKELVENSIDAGAKHISAEIRQGGIDYLRITDDGCGIPPEQVRIAFENHATSKLREVKDLVDVATMGFRGEALPSVSAVSRVELTTRTHGADTGTRIRLEAGSVLAVEPAGCPDGTTIQVRDLFFNLPARRAFLKRPATEAGACLDTISRLALGYPGIAFRFTSNGKLILHTQGDGVLRHAVMAVYDRTTAENMIEVDGSIGGLRICGLIGVGSAAKASRAHQHFFVNGRAIRCPVLSQALEQSASGRVLIGRYPMCALSITLPANSVDVNVHPGKLEVRFRDEAALFTGACMLIEAAFRGENMLTPEQNDPTQHINAITAEPTVPSEAKTEAAKLAPEMPQSEAAKPAPEAPQSAAAKPAPEAPQSADAKPSPEAPQSEDTKPSTEMPYVPPRVEQTQPSFQVGDDAAAMQGFAAFLTQESDTVTASEKKAPQAQSVPRETSAALPKTSVAPVREMRIPSGKRSEENPQPEQIPTLFEQAGVESGAAAEPVTVIGTAFATYILVQQGNCLYMIDQHAAHERILYEKYLAQWESGIVSQPLLVPYTVTVSAAEKAQILENLDLLAQIGFVIEDFGDREIQVRAVPQIMGQPDLRPFFLMSAAELKRLKNAPLVSRREAIMQQACKHAVKGGDVLSQAEISALLDTMRKTGAPASCPHGRPVIIAMTRTEIEKKFSRIV